MLAAGSLKPCFTFTGPRRALPEERECGPGLENPDRRPRKALRVARDDGIAAHGFGGGRAHRILEVGPSEGEGPAQDRAIHRSDARNEEKVVKDPAREALILVTGHQVEDRSYAVSREKRLDLVPLGRGPQERCGRGVRTPIEDEVENDVGIEEDSSQRYFRSR